MRRLHFRFAVVTLGVWLVAATPAGAQDSTEEFQKVSLQQIMGSSWPQFERTLAALTADPRNDQAFGELSVVLGEAGALNKVAPYLELALKQRPDDLTMRIILGRVCKDLLHDGARAKLHFEAVLKADDANFFAHYQLGALLARSGEKDFPPAMAHYRWAIEKIPRQYADLRTRILREMGDLLYSRRDANPQYEGEAMAAWDAVTGGSRKFDLQTYEELAGEYRSRQLWKKEREVYERYFAVLKEINDTPDNVTRCRLKTRIAEACEKQGQYATAVEALTEAASLLDENAPQRRALESRIRQCRMQLGQGPQHEQELRRAIDAAPQSIAARQSLARVLVQEGRLDDAAATLDSARQLSPRNVPILSAMEAIYRKAGRDDQLAGILRARIDLSAEDYSACLDLADQYVRTGKMPEAQKVLADMEVSASQLPEKYLLLARACGRYGLVKRAFLLYKKVIDSGGAGSDDCLEFCDFCLAHEGFAVEASAQATALCDGSMLDAAGYARLAEVFRGHDKSDLALGILARGLARCAKRPDGRDDRQAVFALNLSMSDLEHSMGAGHRSQAIGSTLRALLSAGDLHFKLSLNDRLVTLLTNYGHRSKLLYSPQEELTDAKLLGGRRGEGIAPWLDFLSTQANSHEDADLWMLLGQVHEAVEVDTELPARASTQPATAPATRRVKTSLAQARLCYQKVVDMEFQNIDAHLAMARVLSDPVIDEYEHAVDELEVLSLLNTATRWESLQAMGDLFASAGENELAGQKWQAVAEQSTGEPNLLNQVAMRMFRGGDLKSAIELSQRAKDINPNVLAYRLSAANLMGRWAASEATPGNISKYVDELAEALSQAQKSPASADRAAAILPELLHARLSLARGCFDAGDTAAARVQFERAVAMLKSAVPGETADEVAQAELQLARCTEGAGDRVAAMARYEAVVKDRPEMWCWLSGGLSASGRTFLEMKRRESQIATQTTSASGPASHAPAASLIADISLDDSVRAVLAVPPSMLHLEGSRGRYDVDSRTGKPTATSQRAEPLAPGPASLLAAGEGRALCVVASDVAMLRLDSGQVLWQRPANELSRLGRVLGVKANDQAVVISCQKGLQALGVSDGKTLWEQKAAPDGFDIWGNMAVVLAAEEGVKYWATFDLKSGRQIARQAVAADTLWTAPVLFGQTVLMSDSLGGVIIGFDANSGRRQFELALERPLAGPPVAAGDKVLLHPLRAGAINVSILDPTSLRLCAQVPLSAGGHDVGGLGLPPLMWKDFALYCDARSGSVLSAHLSTGRIELVDVKAAPSTSQPTSAPAMAAISWTICGDALCIVGADGHVRLLRLEIPK
jgi:tetratricopeptide (TPR) repeat protein